MHEHVTKLSEGSILKGLSELRLSDLGNATRSVRCFHSANGDLCLLDTEELVVVLGGWVTHLGSSSGDKDLVSGQVTGSGVVLTVRDSPRVVWDEQDRVENPSDKVVDALAGRVRLVTTLVAEGVSYAHLTLQERDC